MSGGAAFTLTVNGANFVQGAVVGWNGGDRTTTFVSSGQLTVAIAASDIARSQKASVIVVNPGGVASAPVFFTVVSGSIAYGSSRALDGSDANSPNNAPNIWLMNADGSGSTPLTAMTVHLFDSPGPIWSPSGAKIAFTSTRALDGSDALNQNATANIWVMNADGSSVVPLTQINVPGGNSGGPGWSPDGSKIVYISQRTLDGLNVTENTSLNVWVMNADGSASTPLTSLNATNANTETAAWSPDGSKIAFASTGALDGSNAANAALNIWVMNADGSNTIPLTRITASGGDSSSPVWSADGSRIAFQSARALDGSNAANAHDASNIWVMNADGSNPTPLTRLSGGSNSQDPVWSPDSTKIAFPSNRALDGSDGINAATNIWVMNADGSNATALAAITTGLADSFDPVWSPDGARIVFQSARALNGTDAVNTNGTKNIWVMNADGSGATALTQLTATGASSINAEWHP